MIVAPKKLSENQALVATKKPTPVPKPPVLDIYLWHKRMGYLNSEYLRQLKTRAATGINFPDGFPDATVRYLCLRQN